MCAIINIFALFGFFVAVLAFAGAIGVGPSKANTGGTSTSVATVVVSPDVSVAFRIEGAGSSGLKR